MITLEYNNTTKTNIAENILQSLFKNAQTHLPLLMDEDGAIEATILSDAEMAKLNESYRGKAGPTDVLSFSYFEGESVDAAKGELFIAAGVAEKQAQEKGHSLQTEVNILFVHGLLHICGYLHDTDLQEAEMEKMAAKILA